MLDNYQTLPIANVVNVRKFTLTTQLSFLDVLNPGVSVQNSFFKRRVWPKEDFVRVLILVMALLPYSDVTILTGSLDLAVH